MVSDKWIWKPWIGKNAVAFLEVEVIFKSLSKNYYRCFTWHLIILTDFIDVSLGFISISTSGLWLLFKPKMSWFQDVYVYETATCCCGNHYKVINRRPTSIWGFALFASPYLTIQLLQIFSIIQDTIMEVSVLKVQDQMF